MKAGRKAVEFIKLLDKKPSEAGAATTISSICYMKKKRAWKEKEREDDLIGQMESLPSAPTDVSGPVGTAVTRYSQERPRDSLEAEPMGQAMELQALIDEMEGDMGDRTFEIRKLEEKKKKKRTSRRRRSSGARASTAPRSRHPSKPRNRQFCTIIYIDNLFDNWIKQSTHEGERRAIDAMLVYRKYQEW